MSLFVGWESGTDALSHQRSSVSPSLHTAAAQWGRGFRWGFFLVFLCFFLLLLFFFFSSSSFLSRLRCRGCVGVWRVWAVALRCFVVSVGAGFVWCCSLQKQAVSSTPLSPPSVRKLPCSCYFVRVQGETSCLASESRLQVARRVECKLFNFDVVVGKQPTSGGVSGYFLIDSR